jgi:hypothetical protein
MSAPMTIWIQFGYDQFGYDGKHIRFWTGDVERAAAESAAGRELVMYSMTPINRERGTSEKT